jgi:Fe-S-cluster containining protein
VALSSDRLQKIKAYVQAMPRTERKRLAAQKRKLEDCGFLDKTNHHCAIYPVRPWICEAFGRVPGMQCPRVEGLVQILPSFLGETSLAAEYESGIIENSSQFDWSKT